MTPPRVTVTVTLQAADPSTSEQDLLALVEELFEQSEVCLTSRSFIIDIVAHGEPQLVSERQLTPHERRKLDPNDPRGHLSECPWLDRMPCSCDSLPVPDADSP